MLNKKVTGLLTATAFAALIGVPAAQAQIGPPPGRLDIYTEMPKADPGDFNWSARQNVVDSDRYERLLRSSPGFRARRIQQECGPITEPGLHQQCVASFY